MTLRDHLNLTSLTEWYMFANTPMYLYQHFRQDSSVQHLAETVSGKNLCDAYTVIARQSDRLLEDVVCAYAYLAALTLQDYAKARPYIDQLASSPLDWTEDISRIFLAHSTVTQQIAFDLPPRLPRIEVFHDQTGSQTGTTAGATTMITLRGAVS